MILSTDNSQIFCMGHPEYDRLTLDKEYKRDLGKGMDIQMPVNYYPNDDVERTTVVTVALACKLLVYQLSGLLCLPDDTVRFALAAKRQKIKNFPISGESDIITLTICLGGATDMAEDRKSFVIRESENGGVNITDEVVAIIAGLAATEVEGVSSLAGNLTNEVISKAGMNKLSKGVKIVTEEENHVAVRLGVNISYGYEIPKICAAGAGQGQECDREHGRT